MRRRTQPEQETKDRGSRPSFWCDFKPGKQRRMLYFFWRCLHCEWAAFLITEIWGCQDVTWPENISWYCRENRCFHSDHQPCKPFFELWEWRIWHGICQNGCIRDKRSVKQNRKTRKKRKTRSCTDHVWYRQCSIQHRVLFFFFGRIFFFVQHLIDNALDNCFFQVDIIA